MVLHLVRIGGITLLLVLCMIYPFLPGKYDGLAAPLSTTAQIFSVAGLLLTPIGALWLADEVRKRVRAPGTLAATNCGWSALSNITMRRTVRHTISFLSSRSFCSKTSGPGRSWSTTIAMNMSFPVTSAGF
jgi:hypothetical protein